jgi:3-phenylpropionate/cinnamic acid dioxygenase small subunit
VNSDLTKKVEALERRVKVLEEERAILSTLYTYGHTIDYGLKAEWLDCFTEDAVYKVQAFGVTLPEVFVPQPSTGFRGRDILSQYIARHTNAPAMWHKHCLVEPIIKLQGANKASVESYFARLDEDQNGAYILAFGRYRDQMVKGRDGKWRFKKRIIEMENRPTKR